MESFKNRQKGFESKFAHDQEMEFKATSRANRLLGLWAAELLGRTGEAAKEYAVEVIKADFTGPGSSDVIAKVAADLGALADEATVRAKHAECTQLARAQLAAESSPEG